MPKPQEPIGHESKAQIEKFNKSAFDEKAEVERAREKVKGSIPIATLLAAAGAVGYAAYQPGSLVQFWYWVSVSLKGFLLSITR